MHVWTREHMRETTASTSTTTTTVLRGRNLQLVGSALSNLPPAAKKQSRILHLPFAPKKHAEGNETTNTHQNLGVRRVFQHHREARHLVRAGLRSGPVTRRPDATPAPASRRPKQGRLSERCFPSSARDGRRRSGVELDALHGAALRVVC